MLVSLLLIVFCGVLSLYYYFHTKKHYEKYAEFYKNPTPLYIPILGSTYLFLGRNLLIAVQSLLKMCGKRCIAYIPHRTYFTADPDEIKIILNEAIDKSREYDHLKGPFGNALLLAKVPKWKKNRKLFSKSFKQNILDSFVPTFNEKSNIIIDILKRKDYEDIYQLFEELTLDIFLEATVGVKSSILRNKDNWFVENITLGQRYLFGRIGNILKMNDFVYFSTPEGKYVKKVIIDGLYKFLEPIIVRKKKEMEEEIVLNCNELPLMDLLLHSAEKEKFSNDLISEEIVLFAAAATDTTAYSLAYVLCLLAMNPEIQKKVYEEVMAVIGENEITAEHLLNLTYTDMCIKESMRLIPAIPLVARQTHCDLDIGTCVIPKDTGLIVNIIDLHRDEKIYPDPLKFDPDRFLPEKVAERHPYSFIPFSGGPRNCIGWKYAQMSMKVTTANIIRNFHITTPYKSISELKFESSVVMNTTHPLELNFIPRNSK